MMQKYKLKRVIGLLLVAAGAAGFFGVMALIAQVIVYTGTGANPALALNVVPTVPLDLVRRVVWLPDELGEHAGHALEPVVRQEITGAYLRAWAQLGVSYQLRSPYGLATYFGGPALTQVTEVVSTTVDSPWRLKQSSVSHALVLTFYADDGMTVAFTDRDAYLVQQFVGKSREDTHIVETESVYDVVMVQEEGRWRIRGWRRQGPATFPGLMAPERGGAIPGVVTVAGDQLALDGQEFPLRGVNYYPSATPWMLFWKNYDAAQTATDLAKASELGLNTVRVFVPYDDFGGETVDPRLREHLHDFLDQAGAHGLKVIVTLFDHRTDHDIATWGADNLHLKGLIPEFARNPNILAWDLKNEADRDAAYNTEALNQAWLAHVARSVRQLDPHHLVTIGWSTPKAARALADVVDFISYHYYGDPAQYGAQVAALRAAVPAKPLVLSEYGRSTWDWLLPNSYTEARQADYVAAIVADQRAQRTAGELIWALFDFTTVPLAEYRFPWQKAAQAHMGVLRSDGSPKPAAALLAAP